MIKDKKLAHLYSFRDRL